MGGTQKQTSFFEEDAARSLLDQLLTDSKLYTQSQDYKDLLNFVSRLRNFAPFNAMLLQMQKPGLSYAASEKDWRERFGRWPKEGARPLLILWPFAPVAFVFDVLDTEGKELPEDTAAFFAQGSIDNLKMHSFVPLTNKKNIKWNWIDAGDQKAGFIELLRPAFDDEDKALYRISINKNHSPPVQFATLTHELGHLFLGHLGKDTALQIPQRRKLPHTRQELEAESVSYLLCSRNGIISKAHTYLAAYVEQNTDIDDIDIYRIMRAAGQVETLLDLSETTTFDKPERKSQSLTG